MCYVVVLLYLVQDLLLELVGFRCRGARASTDIRIRPPVAAQTLERLIEAQRLGAQEILELLGLKSSLERPRGR